MGIFIFTLGGEFGFAVADGFDAVLGNAGSDELFLCGLFLQSEIPYRKVWRMDKNTLCLLVLKSYIFHFYSSK